MVTRKIKIREFPVSTWFIQQFDAIAMRDIRDLANGNEPLLTDRFSNDNDFIAALHEGGITEVAQGDHDQDGNNYDGDSKMDKVPDNPPGKPAAD